MLELSQQPTLQTVCEEQRKTILIVDDEAIIRDLCGKALKGYRVMEAADGEEALQMFEQGGVDVILTDVMMPRMGGIDLLKRLKEIEPTLVVIVMTGFAERDVVLNALKADADDFITKPLNLLQLKTAVDKALVKKALKEEIANLKSLDRFKTNFLSLVSHKFRTPITAISLFLQNLASGVYDVEDPTFQKNIRLIYNEAWYLERLVAELLAFSQVMDTGRGLMLEPCSLDEILVQLLQEAKAGSGKEGLEISFVPEPLPPLPLDREKITFAIRHLLDNACKFSGEKGSVSVILARQGNTCRIVVSDNGIGIARDDLPKIFEKFYQVDVGRTGQVKGFGLGLYYAKEFIRLHGGTISVDSELGKGTRVTVSLPLPAG
jgi:signal transduction histidine kinase